ncbi:hypothetical protein TWF506_009689 [Arthrobotrys conoides]|uniref:Uncharacterized protein n=1 Tax=Arthrobotrys conoides TaxID=74498 RepID=A0AAN8NIL0_9PEZI
MADPPTGIPKAAAVPRIPKSEITLQLVLTTTLALIATTVVLGRLCIRRFYIGKVELDDWVLLVAWIFLMGFTGTQIASVPLAYTLSNNIEKGVFDQRAVILKADARISSDISVAVGFFVDQHG